MADVSEQCLCAFEDGRKEDALMLLSKGKQPEQELVSWAAFHGWQDVCQELVKCYGLSPSDALEFFGGSRPLHLACRMGRAQVVSYLLTLRSVVLTVNEDDGYGQSALDRALYSEDLTVIELLMREPSVKSKPKQYLPSHQFAVLSLLSTMINWSTEFPIRPYFHVFMAGNTAAGKTTLAHAMLKMTDLYSSSHGGWVSGVETLTAGICPMKCPG